MCENEIISEKESPSGDLKAVAFLRNCGATTSFSPQVSIMKTTKKLKNNVTGNVFIGSHSTNVSVTWRDADHLIISHDCPSNHIYVKQNNYKNITIEYSER